MTIREMRGQRLCTALGRGRGGRAAAWHVDL